MSAISGWGGRVRIGGAGGRSLPVGRWNVVERLDPVEVTTMEHGGRGGYVAGVTDWEVTFDCFWDTALGGILLNTSAVVPGEATNAGKDDANSSTNYLQVELFLDKNVGTVWSFGTVLVTNLSMDDEVRGVVRYTVSGINSQPVTFGGASPTSNFNVSRASSV